MKVLLGASLDGRAVEYDAALYEFSLGLDLCSLEQLRALDDQARVRWRANEMRDWFRRIDPVDLAACHERALVERLGMQGVAFSAEERVLADAARDDSVLAGKIVDADPALVQAVASALIDQGLVRDGPPAEDVGEGNPLAHRELPRGMEQLSQFERAQGDRRKMTRSEKRLMKKILRNDDKQKARLERQARAQAQSQAQTQTQTQEGQTEQDAAEEGASKQ